MLLHDSDSISQTVGCLNEDWLLQAGLGLLCSMLLQFRSIDPPITLRAEPVEHLLALIVLDLEVQTNIAASCFCIDFGEQVLEARLQTSFQEDPIEVIEL